MALEYIDVTRSPHVYGIESLLAVKLRDWLVKVMKAELAGFCITEKVLLRWELLLRERVF